MSEPVADPMALASVYRPRMRITGEDPVVIDGYLEREHPRNPIWEVLDEVDMLDASPTRIDAPGRLGFSAHTELEYFEYDDFAYTILDP